MEGITAKELETRIREILENGTIRYTFHVKEKMAERKYSIEDVLHILKNGNVLDNFVDQGNEEYHCEVRGEDLDGEKGAVITIVIKTTKLKIVTVLGGT